MKRKYWLIALIVILGLSSVRAQDRPFGLGLMFGYPAGISLKYWIDDQQAVDGGITWSFYYGGYFQVHADYLRHAYVIDVSQGKLPFYYGIGARLGFGNYTRFGARVPLGIEYIIQNAPVDIFLEIVPGMEFLPDPDFSMEGAVGFRYFF
ncbi:MAG: hypothetical protein KBB71_13300 [Lentimicrobiaceae bacterium]|nr:hypothetical protein [Lentimicrobiaceae bacterium]